MNAGPKTACGGKRPLTGVMDNLLPAILAKSWFPFKTACGGKRPSTGVVAVAA